MLKEIGFYKAFGLNTPTIVPLIYMCIRGCVMYFIGIFFARFNKKLMGIRTPFNFILFVMLGSIFAGAIMDGNLFFPIIGTVLVLILLNGLMTMFSFYSPGMENFMKGKPSVLVKDGTIQWGAMRKNFITQQELINELHTQLHTDDISSVQAAFLASDGTINFIKKK